MDRRAAGELLDVARVLLLVQCAVLTATTLEALIWSAAFRAPGVGVLLSAAAAFGLLVVRARVRADRTWTRRFTYVIEGVILLTLAIDSALALALAGALPPPVALVTRLVMPLSVIALLRSAARAARLAPATEGLKEAA